MSEQSRTARLREFVENARDFCIDREARQQAKKLLEEIDAEEAAEADAWWAERAEEADSYREWRKAGTTDESV